jgi:hypothetical protein
LGSPPLPGTTWNLLDVLAVNAFVAVQAALSGFLIGVLFQHFHQRTAPLGEAIDRLKNRGSDLLKENFEEEKAAAAVVNGSKPARATKDAVEEPSKMSEVEATLVPSDQQSAVAERNQEKERRRAVVLDDG